ncbi:MAG: response regulator [Bdellovibrionaceae bacterium]|nr:response regulator [Pseudobdellovibrionaceae bacterium]
MKRILVVDDNENNLYYLDKLMGGHGWQVILAHHGAEALMLARQQMPDIIVSDLLMPVMDGYTLLHHWKTDEKLKKIPFVVYTATYTESEDERLALSLGADSFFLKPIEPEDFLSRIHVVLERAALALPAIPKNSVQPIETNEKLYNEALVRKLEQKMIQLEESNQILKRDQAELRMLESAIRAVSQGIIITDPNRADNPIVYVSPGFQKLTGYTEEESVGRNCRFLQGKETGADARAKISKALQEARNCQVEILNYRKDGSTFWNRLNISPVTDGGGRLTHFVGVLSDITQERHLETQLRQSQKMRAIGTLAGGVAHDFNNLLAVIGLHVENILAQVPAEATIRKGLESILKAQDRGAGLTRQLLAFSRKQGVELRPVDIDKTVKGLVDMLGRIVGEDIELETEFGDGEKIILGDPHQLEQLVTNLVINARDAIQIRGRISIQTSLFDGGGSHPIEAEKNKPKNFVKLVVSDTGRGMDEETQSRIFEPFFTTKEIGKGTGLGLSTVDGLVRQFYGHINVKSKIGSGTSFEIYLPITDQPITASVVPKSQLTAINTGITILVAEDQPDLRLILARTLRDAGYTVLEAQNGETALEMYKNYGSKIHLIITDVVMPKMGGREFSEKLTQLNPEVIVLFLSGYTEDTLLRYGLSGTKNHRFIDKPFTAQTLLSKVRDLLG